MAIPRCKITLRGSATALATFKTALDVALTGVTISQTLRDWAVDNGARVHDLYVGSTGDLDTLRTFMGGRVAGLRAAGVTGKMTLHQCSHTDPTVVSCKDHPGSAYQEVRV